MNWIELLRSFTSVQLSSVNIWDNSIQSSCLDLLLLYILKWSWYLKIFIRTLTFYIWFLYSINTVYSQGHIKGKVRQKKFSVLAANLSPFYAICHSNVETGHFRSLESEFLLLLFLQLREVNKHVNQNRSTCSDLPPSHVLQNDLKATSSHLALD